VGRLGITSPPSRFRLQNHRYYVPLRLPEALLRFVRSSLSSPDTLRASFALCLPLKCKDSLTDESRPVNARALDLPVPLIFRVLSQGSLLALPSSRVTPLSTCPGLRPRWCPHHLPYRNEDCCLPLHSSRRLSL